MRKPGTVGSLGRVNPRFLEILYFQEFCLSRPRHFLQKSTKNHQKQYRGPAPCTPSELGCAPPTPQGSVLFACLHLYLMTLTLYLALQCIQYTQFHSLPTPVVFLMNRSHDLVSFLAAGYVRSRYRINLSLLVSPFASWTLDELLLSLSIVPKNWSISTIRFFFV